MERIVRFLKYMDIKFYLTSALGWRCKIMDEEAKIFLICAIGVGAFFVLLRPACLLLIKGSPPRMRGKVDVDSLKREGLQKADKHCIEI